MNNRQKMYKTNSLVKKWLFKKGFKDIHFFPHTRYSKDVHFSGFSADGLARKENRLVLFQIKTNKKPTKKMLSLMNKIEKESGILLYWFDKPKGFQKLKVFCGNGENYNALP